MEEDMFILEECFLSDARQARKENRLTIEQIKFMEAIENLIARNKELEEELKRIKSLSVSKLVEEYETGQLISKSKIKEKIEELDKRIDYLDKELTKAYIVREKLGTETDIDTNEQYIYNMEQERSIRYTQKYAYKELLD